MSDEPSTWGIFERTLGSSGSLYRQVLTKRQNLYDEALSVGKYTPFMLPWDLLPAVLLVFGVTVCPRLPFRINKTCCCGIWCLQLSYYVLRWPQVRTLGLACGYGIGLAAQWGFIMTFVLLILHNPGQDYMRIEVRAANDHDTNEATASKITSSTTNGAFNVRRRAAKDVDDPNNTLQPKPLASSAQLIWQPYPREVRHLMDWSFDLITSFRGIHWNFRGRRYPRPSIALSQPSSDSEDSDSKVSRGVPIIPSLQTGMREFQKKAIRNFLFYYVLIDALKTFMVTEPYFLGIAPLESRTSWRWLAHVATSIPIATKVVRLCLSLVGVTAALTFIFSLAPLSFAVVIPALLGESLSSITKSPLLERWMYPPQWGPMAESLCNRGLAGMWGTWWHQMFRYGISEPSRCLLEKLNIDRKSDLGRVIQTLVAFGLSGSIHAVAASTTFSIIPSQPLKPLLFFIGQGLGVTIQATLAQWLVQQTNPAKIVRQGGNLAFVIIWLWFSGPLLADDFARCGIWLFEPVPISVFRGLGFGPADTWIPWLPTQNGSKWVGLWKGDAWYSHGLAIF